MSRKKYVPICLLIDLLGGHQQPTTKRKTERQIVLIGMKGTEYCMVTRLNFFVISHWGKQAHGKLATNIVTVTAAVRAVLSLG